MGDRCQEAAFVARLSEIDDVAQALGRNNVGERPADIGDRHGERIDACRTLDDAGFATHFASGDDGSSVLFLNLR